MERQVLRECKHRLNVEFFDLGIVQPHLRHGLRLAELRHLLLVDILGKTLLVDVDLYEPIAAPFDLSELGFQGRPSGDDFLLLALPHIEDHRSEQSQVLRLRAQIGKKVGEVLL